MRVKRLDYFDDRIIPIQIRPDVTVSVFGIPHDLTETEAAKIARVIEALATKTLA